jgi:hypothetical protein
MCPGDIRGGEAPNGVERGAKAVGDISGRFPSGSGGGSGFEGGQVHAVQLRCGVQPLDGSW